MGLGINLQPHAVREVIELSLGEELDEVGVPTAELVYVDQRGRQLYQEPCEWAARLPLASVLGAPGPLADGAGWKRPGRLSDPLPHIQGWRVRGLELARLVARSPQIPEHPMADRDPLDRWGNSRVTLLGDAAHPMYPVGANGASQTVVDGRVLACELATGDLGEALRRYETARGDAARGAVLAAREMDCAEREVRQSVLTRSDPCGDDFRQIYGDIASAYRSRTGNDVAALNARPSLTPPQRRCPR